MGTFPWYPGNQRWLEIRPAPPASFDARGSGQHPAVAARTQQQKRDADRKPRDEVEVAHRIGDDAATGGHASAWQVRSVLGALMHRANDLRISIPVIGEVRLPPAPNLAFFAAVGALTAFGLIQWPVALIVIIGHVLATNARSGTARGFGEGMAQA
ncbi:MAG: hypothetical protein JWP76_1660 [Dactylosporangium sp.]|nr:hypothetical protein [Dactylosporangium sp.]